MQSREPTPDLEARVGWQRVVRHLVDIRPGELRTVMLATLYFFCLLAGYFVLRPVRESLGLLGGADKLPYLFTGSLVAMFVVTPPFAWLATRWPRKRFIPAVYVVSIAALVAFWVALRFGPAGAETAIANGFYVFVSVFNLFVVSIFWAFMADLWNLEQAKRLFGFIGASGTVGAIVGGQLTNWLAKSVGTENLILVSAAFIAVSVACVIALVRLHEIDAGPKPAQQNTVERTDEPDAWRGLRLVASQPYLRSIAAYVFLHGMIGTYLYLQQGKLVEASIPNRDDRTALFALIDTLSNSATLFIQVFFTGRLIRWLGITFALVSQPVIAFIGWIVLALASFESARLASGGFHPGGLLPELAVLIGVQVLLRSSNFATVRPAREALFTVVEREVKYKSKSFVDTFVYRLGDGVGAWTFKGLLALQVSLPMIAAAVVPLAAVWIGVGATLGKRQRALTEP